MVNHKIFVSIVLIFTFFCGASGCQKTETQSTEAPELIPFRKDNKWGFCDKNKKIVIPLKYDAVYPFWEGLAAVNIGAESYEGGAVSGGKWGFIDKTGKEVIPLKYDCVFSFVEDLAAVSNEMR